MAVVERIPSRKYWIQFGSGAQVSKSGLLRVIPSGKEHTASFLTDILRRRSSPSLD